MFKHLMIDLETLGLTPGCVITQIGLVAFNEDDDEITSEQIRVSIDSCLRAGLTVDGSTIRWWFGQSADARAEMANDDGLSLAPAIAAVHNFVNSYAQSAKIWAHGASFDPPILEAAAKAVDLGVPWHFRKIRDTRTLVDLSPRVEKPDPEIAHSAVHDAISQAIWTRSMLRAVRAAQK